MRQQQQQHEHMSALAQGIAHIDGRINILAAALKDLVTCETLATETRAFDVNGQITFSWNFSYAAVAVSNFSAQKVTVTSMGPQGSAPATGPGIAMVQPNKGAVHNLSGTMLTLYGNPGDQVTVSVFARPQPPTWG